jgi:adenylylsulfate kinase-like enzyme
MIYFHHVDRTENMRRIKMMGRLLVMRDLMEVRKVLVEKSAEKTI